MDFFGAQERARRKTWQLAARFVAAVVTLVGATNVVGALVAAFTSTQGVAAGGEGILASTPVETWLAISAIVMFVIAAGVSWVMRVLISTTGPTARGMCGAPMTEKR